MTRSGAAGRAEGEAAPPLPHMGAAGGQVQESWRLRSPAGKRPVWGCTLSLPPHNPLPHKVGAVEVGLVPPAPWVAPPVGPDLLLAQW